MANAKENLNVKYKLKAKVAEWLLEAKEHQVAKSRKTKLE